MGENIRSFDRQGRGKSWTLDTALDLEKRIELFASEGKNWSKSRILETAKEMGVDWRTLGQYVKNPSKLEELIGKLRRADDWAYFLEGVRLFSTPVTDVIEYMKKYIPYFTTARPFAKKSDGKLQRLGSVPTCHNKALECFDTSLTVRTIRDREADIKLNTTVGNSLKEWEPGTIGVHAINITWQLDHGKGSDRKAYSETGGFMRVMLMAERRLGQDKAVSFSLLPPDVTEEYLANKINEFLKGIEGSKKVVRLITEKVGNDIVPTAIDKDVLQSFLGDLAAVEMDAPTVGMRGACNVSNRTAKVFRVNGRFRSEAELNEHLWKILQEGHRVFARHAESG